MANTILYIAITVIIILAIATYYFKKYMARKEIEKKTLIEGIPKDIYHQFQLAEKMLSDSNGDKSPQEILWYIAKNHRKIQDLNINSMKGGLNGGEKCEERRETSGETANTGGDNPSVVSTEPTVETAELPGKLEGGQDVQTGVANSDDSSDRSNQSSQSNSKGNVFSRFIRRK